MSEREVYVAQKGELRVWELPKRELEPKEVYVQVKAVGIEPIDVLHVDEGYADGCGQGNNFSGVVAQVGSEVTQVKVGDFVAGGAIGGNVDAKEDGAFAKLVKVPEHVLIPFAHLESAGANATEIPEGPIETFEQAATIGVDLGNAGVGVLFPKLGDAQLNKLPQTSSNPLVEQLGSITGKAPNEVSALGYFWLQQPVKKLGTKAAPAPSNLTQEKSDAILKELRAVAPKLKTGSAELLHGFDQIPKGLELVRAKKAAKVVISV